MMRRFLSLFTQDIILTYRNGLILVTGITLAAVVLLYWTLPLMVPDDATLHGAQLILDRTDGGVFREAVRRHEQSTDRFVDSEEELQTTVGKGNGIIGIIVDGNRTDIDYTLVFKSSPREENINIIKAVLRSFSAEIMGEGSTDAIRIERMRPAAGPVAVNDQMIVILITFEVMILGFLFIAVVVFGEKKEGSIRAFRVTPAGTVQYVLSKTLLFTLLSLGYGVLMVLCTIGPGTYLLPLSAVLFIACAMMTMLGLGIAVFFQNISQWFAPGVVVLTVNMLAIIPFNIPTFSHPVISLLPGYTVIFGVDEILFPTGKAEFLLPLFGTLSVQCLIAALFCLTAVRRKLMREG